jgi:23S rRNA (cytosine1962-C5)-methyltransferase
MQIPVLSLKPREDKRLRIGHLWVYSNEVDIAKSPLKGLEPGALCRVEDSRGQALGLATVNPNALICGRLLTRRADAGIDVGWFCRRIERALDLRERIFDRPFYRLAYGESDGLPGLVIDRYGDVCVVQISTAGMERLKTEITEALKEVLRPAGILFRNDIAMREMEGLPAYVEALGQVPEQVEIDEGGVRFRVPLDAGQKTGWFYDQHANRDRLAPYVRDKRVLDVFSYIGGWALRAGKFGASSLTTVDSSATALEAAQHNATLNGMTLEAMKGQATDVLKQLRDAGRRFDVVIVDPPALIKRKKDMDAGAEHYAQLNRLAMQLLDADGTLVSCSCSHHMTEEHLQRLLLREARNHRRTLQILERGGQGPDHPVHPAIPETFYLKAFYCRVLDTGA